MAAGALGLSPSQPTALPVRESFPLQGPYTGQKHCLILHRLWLMSSQFLLCLSLLDHRVFSASPVPHELSGSLSPPVARLSKELFFSP